MIGQAIAFINGVFECRNKYKTHYAVYSKMVAYDAGVAFGNSLLFWRRA